MPREGTKLVAIDNEQLGQPMPRKLKKLPKMPTVDERENCFNSAKRWMFTAIFIPKRKATMKVRIKLEITYHS
ncbi:hypothetical protein HZA96_06415 [Candidatus Woesearchaeota archaeon]|nr:hypothetical protein [Candidatus Woesearchaeota archaeon]